MKRKAEKENRRSRIKWRGEGDESEKVGNEKEIGGKKKVKSLKGKKKKEGWRKKK